jgi:hypothetical protein
MALAHWGSRVAIWAGSTGHLAGVNWPTGVGNLACVKFEGVPWGLTMFAIVFRFSSLHTPRMKNGRDREKRKANVRSEALFQGL